MLYRAYSPAVLPTLANQNRGPPMAEARLVRRRDDRLASTSLRVLLGVGSRLLTIAVGILLSTGLRRISGVVFRSSFLTERTHLLLKLT
jgi:hypothetical protein